MALVKYIGKKKASKGAPLLTAVSETALLSLWHGASIMDNNNNNTYVATIGFFDGVHQGHKYLIRQVKDEAKERGMKSMVVTFLTHPRKVLHADYQPALLTTCDEKVALLRREGVDEIVLMPFTCELSQMSAREFMQKLHSDYGVDVLVIGYDHRFGHDRSEGFDDYVRYGKDMSMDVVQALEEPDGIFSSTVVRNALVDGDVEGANAVLGYPYFMQGNVVGGYHVGTQLGYPTANIQVDADKLVPKDGAYAVRVRVADREYVGMLNIGVRPTLNNGTNRSIEVHILDFDGDLYGKSICMEFFKFIRKEQKFDSIDSLRAQLKEDESVCRQLFR